VLKALSNRMPRMSATEKAALEAGTVWLDGELFSGKPDLQRIMAESYPSLTEEEQAFLDGPVEEVCRMVDPWAVSRERELPREAWTYLKEKGFFGLCLPKRYGGHGFSQLAASSIFAKLVTRSGYLSTVVLIPNSVGPGELLLEYGTREQKDHFLPRLALGEDIPCFALTEPEAGSDAASLTSKGKVFRRSDGRLMVRLSWNKRYITLAPVATLIGLACQLEDPEELLGAGPKPGITCLLVPAETPGVEIGRHHDPLGLPFPNGPIRGRKVEVPVDSIIGGPEQAGQGWRMLMEALSGGRAISLPGQAAGGAKWTARVAGAYASVRQQFGVPIRRFEGIQEPLARIAGRAYLMEAARVFTCGAVDSGQKPSVVSALMKYSMTELARSTIQDGMDVLGGAAISKGPHNLLADAHIASPIGITVEGANILTRTLITFGQGVMRCHPYARRELEAVAAGDRSSLLKALAGHGGFLLRGCLRTLGLSVTRGRLKRAPVSGATAGYHRKLAWASSRFALLTDLALVTYGAQLKRKGQITGRYADALSWMYLGFAALRRFEAEGRRKEDLPLVQWAAETSLQRIQEAFEGIYRNLEAPFAGLWLRSLPLLALRLNPLSRGPSDRLIRRAARRLTLPGEARDRLTPGLCLEGPGIERLERAFETAQRAAPILKRIREAQQQGAVHGRSFDTLVNQSVASGLVTTAEADSILEARAARQAAIQVDDFSPEEYRSEREPKPLDQKPALRAQG